MTSHFVDASRAAISLAILVLAACGGGGGIAPPSGLSYAQPPAFVINHAIAPLMPTVTGQVTSYAVAPALPTGLALDSATGASSGTPTAIAAKSSYTVTAGNAGGSTTASVSIGVNDVAPTIAYSIPYFAYTAGLPAQAIKPTTSGGAIITWSVSPALPAGFTLSQADGSISGQPTAAAASATYTITAANSGRQSSATLTIAVAAAPLLDLGLVSAAAVQSFAAQIEVAPDRQMPAR
jgi:Putative Ig domain